ncbi:MAG TPA: TetR/AcrR family transcriptional regulator [Solirubrobacterales bacterium]|nr:TetR/AcrR family transcriptional regulator [Solirubrobacterales bacterium]
MPPRLTRKERKANTRSNLLRSAAKVFCRKGMEGGSIDEVAQDAGYTKGAFYANFKSKEELFLAMLDERFEERLEEIDRVAAAGGGIEDQAREAGADFARHLGDDEWHRLFLEFTAYAARDEDFRQELTTRLRSLRERIAAVYRSTAEQAGTEPPLPVEQVAMMTFTMANGFALAKLLEPDEVPDELFGTMLAVLFTGLGAIATEREAV